MAIAKSLDILLRAPTGKLDADFRKAAARANEFFRNVGGLAAGFTAAFSMAGFVAKINQAFNEVDAIAKRALSIGIDFTELQGLDLAANLSGVAVGGLDTAFRTLTRSIIAANDGSKVQSDLFRKLGIEAKELTDLSFPQQLEKIAAGLGTITNSTEKANAAIQLFGRSGLQLLPLLANNGAALADSLRDAERLGGFFTSSETAAIEASNDAFTRLNFAFNAIFQRIAVDLAPALQRLFVNLTEAIKPGTALNGVMLQFGSFLQLGVNLLNEFAGFLRFTSEAFGTLTGKVVAGVVAAYSMYRVIGLLRMASQSYLRIQKALAVVEAARASLNVKTAALVVGAGVAVAVFSNELNGLIDQMLGVGQAQQGVNDQIGDFIDLSKQAAQPRKINLASATAGSQAALEQLFTVRSQGGIGAVGDKIDQTNDILGQIRDGMSQAGNVIPDVEEVTF